MKNKKGFSLIVLIITVIIMMVLASVIISNATIQVSDSKVTVLSLELTDLESQITQYYILNKELPKLDSQITPLTNIDIANRSSLDSASLSNEITLNNDNNSEFYHLDFAKLGIQSGDRGFGDPDTSDDIFVVAFPTLNVYYVRGIFADEKYFFSMTPKMPNYHEVDLYLGSEDVSEPALNYTGISYDYRKFYTSDLDVEIKTVMSQDEALYLSICGGTELLINNTSLGDYTMNFSSLDDLLSQNIVTGLTQTEINKIEIKGTVSDRYIEIIKKLNGVNLTNIKLDLNNYSITPTQIHTSGGSAPVITENASDNSVLVTCIPGDAPVTKVKYEFLAKLNASLVEEYYFKDVDIYDVTQLDMEYVRSYGKDVNIENDTFTIVVPSDITAVQILLLDEAGNYSEYVLATYIP